MKSSGSSCSCLVLGVLPAQSWRCLRADTPTYHTVSLYPCRETQFGSAASQGLRKGREYLPLICNCSAATKVPVGCREIPTQVGCGRFPAMTNFYRVVPKCLRPTCCALLLLLSCLIATIVAESSSSCLTLKWGTHCKGKGVSPETQPSQGQEYLPDKRTGR